jgi:ABC-type uncharacterized transport system involved in gliding motility auxiliary subunit
MREKFYEWADYFAAVAFALWVAAGILFLLKSQSNERLLLLVILGVAFFLVYLYFKFGLVRAALTSRTARYGSNALLLSLALIAIIGVLNFMGQRYHLRLDVTANKTFTLSDKTTQVLQNLKEPVQAIAFFSTDNAQSQQEAADRLREYSRITDKLTYKFIDPYAEPQIANDYKVSLDGTVVFERGKRRENTYQLDEQSFTNALLKVSQDQQPTIYFTTGHGEHSPDDSGNEGYSTVKSALELDNYKIGLLDLTTLTTTLPSDITALVIAGPKQSFNAGEVNSVKDYLDHNGRVLILVDPQVESGLDGLLKEWGLALDNDSVFDPRFGFTGQPQVPVINTYKSHPVTQDLTGQRTFFPGGARSIQSLAGAQSSRSPTALFSTSDVSWGETDFASVMAQTAKQDDKDKKGPLDLAYAVQDTGDKPARLVVMGNSAFVTNYNLRSRGVTSSGQQFLFGNDLLFANSTYWLAGQETLIAIPAKTEDSHPIFLNAEETLLVFWSSFLLIPLAILIIGALVWWRRR